ncbi:T-cell-specific guanine nucleotide triphosphate-binding protein 2-like isoform X2 [Mya arenaria]|nr:T-cell-specific guanine nucleotide triphosphate-binding protein 2-like isoform X2 [Mya arenaria]
MASESIPLEEQKELLDEYNKNGPLGFKSLILRKIDKWKETPLHIAVTGTPGAGKSSFINTCRGLLPSDRLAAGVGVTETTRTVTKYQHPKMANVALYDLPGIGTSNYPNNSYLQMVNFEKYDFFVIISCSRFTENDAWLAKEVEKKGKHFYLVRSKIDIDIENNKRDFNRGDKETQKIVKEDLEACLRDLQILAPVYLISSLLKDVRKYDSPALTDNLIESTPKIKKQALVLWLPTITKKTISEKVDVLKKRATYMALASGIFGAVPLPVVSIGIDAAIILGEAKFYRQQFYLDDESLKKIEHDYSIKIDGLHLASRDINFTEDGIVASVAMNIAGTLGKIVLPIIGSIFAGYHYHNDTRRLLWNIINTMEKDALKINYEIAEKMF